MLTEPTSLTMNSNHWAVQVKYTRPPRTLSLRFRCVSRATLYWRIGLNKSDRYLFKL